MTCPVLSHAQYINILLLESAFCFFHLNCKLQLSQLKEPINSGPSGTMVQTMNSRNSSQVVNDLWEWRKWLFIMTCLQWHPRAPTWYVQWPLWSSLRVCAHCPHKWNELLHQQNIPPLSIDKHWHSICKT